MNRNALKILGRVARQGEMPRDEAIRMSHKRGGDQRNQYSLALLSDEDHGDVNRMDWRRRR
jgi:hypothetical protein